MFVHHMDKLERLAFLSSVDAEEDFLEGRVVTSSPIGTGVTPPGGRRLSAAGKAAALKAKNLIPPLNSPTDRRISLPRASKVSASTPPSTPEMPTAGKRGQALGETPTPATPAAPPRQDMDRSILEEITKRLDGLKADIAGSTTSMGEKIDGLSTKLTAQLDKAERDLSNLGGQVAASRQDMDNLKDRLDVQENSLANIVEEAVAKKFATIAGNGEKGRRPRLLGQTRTVALQDLEAEGPPPSND